ncbi:hypothetical protein DESUT3_02960 [Desulfuromonas versatilis]|uniref:EamA domain-containing protein n=1 Tax=Desulfuromonas versatilis TaxID=2802975 RepID=A0ABM8HRJ9_9BACT|nr:DMT family transporter [Desulfuromonas versatilis]BCR03227.1 hypothetical protein DESUT3_02960 [Desulfuromonas versatilis]
MTWIALSLFTAFFESAKDVFGKRGLRNSDEFVVAWAWRFFALPFLLPLLLVIEIPSLDRPFWWALAVSGGLNAVTSVLYLRAIRLSDLSLTVPMVTFTPMLLLLTSPLILGERPGPLGVLGVLLIVLGAYLLNVKQRGLGLLAPFRALLAEPGPRLMLLVAATWSVTANVDKIGLQHSSPLFWAIAVNLTITLLLLPLAAPRLRRDRARVRANLGNLLAIGACGGLTLICQMTAISLTLVPYVIAIKRTSTLMSVGWGWLLFGEKGIANRLAGVAVMVLGVVLISLS